MEKNTSNRNLKIFSVTAIAASMLTLSGLYFGLGTQVDSPTEKPKGNINGLRVNTVVPAIQVEHKSDVVSDRIALALSQKIAKRLENLETRDEEMKNLSIAAGSKLSYIPSPLPDVHVFKVDALADGSIGTQTDRRKLMSFVVGNLLKFKGVLQAEEDMLMFHTFTPADPEFTEQWHLQSAVNFAGAISAPVAWDKSTGSGIVIGVVDTGITDHPDLDTNVLPGYDFITSSARAGDGDGWDNDAHDLGDFVTSSEAADSTSPFFGCPVSNSSWHGTHVAGIISAQANNNQGISGVAPNAKILPVRVLGKCGGYATDIAAGIYWASGSKTLPLAPTNPNPAQIINLSLGAKGNCPFFYSGAIVLAKRAGSTVVIAAGNNNMDVSQFAPANCGGVVVVGAVGQAGSRSYYSNFGAKISVSSPGGDSHADGADKTILSTINTGETTTGTPAYGRYQGTSMAAPVVSGVLALTMAARPGLSSANAAEILISESAAFPPGAACASGGCGKGIVSASGSVGIASELGADLAVDQIKLTDYSLIPQIPTSLTFQLSNIGNISAAGDITIKSYISSSNILDDTAMLLSETTQNININAGKYTNIKLLNIPIPVVGNGDYYIHASVVPVSVLVKANTTANDSKTSSVVSLATPSITVIKKMQTDQAPTTALFGISIEPATHLRRVMRSDIKKLWFFNETAAKDGIVTKVNFATEGEYSIKATISHPGGFTASATNQTTITTPTPYSINIVSRASNSFMRAPLSVSSSLSTTGGHPLDKPIKIEWSLDESPLLAKNFITVSNLAQGAHSLKAVMTSKYGVITTTEQLLTVVANQPPVCNMNSRDYPDRKYVIFTALCTDSDGKIKKYVWSINGVKVPSWNSIYKVTYTNNNPIIASVDVTDDSNDTTSANINFTH